MVVFLFLSLFSFASKTDSITIILNSGVSDSAKLSNGLRFINQAELKNKKQAELSYEKLEIFLKKQDNIKLLNALYRNQSTYYKDFHRDYSLSLTFANKWLKSAEKMKDSVSLIEAYKHLGVSIYADMDLKDEALLALRNSLKYCRANSMEKADGLYFLGWMEFNMKMYDSSLVHLKKCLDISEKLKPRKDLVEFIGWVGNAYGGIKNYEKAIAYRKEALKLSEENGDTYNASDCNRYLAQFYYHLQQYDSCIYFADITFTYIRNNRGKTQQEAFVYNGAMLINACIKANKLALGESYIKVMTDPTLEPCVFGSGARVLFSKVLAKFYEAKGDNAKTIYYLKDYLMARDSADLSKQSMLVSEQLLKNDFEKEQQHQLIEQQKKDLETDAQVNRQKLMVLSAILVLLLVSLLLFLSYKSGKQKKASLLEISSQKQEIELQKEIVDVKNREIIESINYAKRLQDAILPPMELIKLKLPDSFIYYQPKDIVAGDFYWMEEGNGKLFIAAADSTGHGVPGALVSIVCSNALNRSVKEFKLTDPALILDKTRELVLETFSKSESNVKDGMDITLACIDFASSYANDVRLYWAGANNPLWYIKKNNSAEVGAGGYEFFEIKGDKQPIGYIENAREFASHEISLQKGDMIYLFTDGYADQFGGPKGKKFKYKPIQEILLSNHLKPLAEQRDMLENVFIEWRGNLEQVDDVCVIGIRL